LAEDRTNEFFQERHRLYHKYRSAWEKMFFAYKGGEEFKSSKRFLWPYEAEAASDWELRSQRAAYENHLRDIIDRRASILFSRKIARDPKGGKRTRWEELNEDIDLRGTPREEFVRKAFMLCQIFGWLPVLVDYYGRGEGETDKDREELGERPYWVPILPFDFVNWSTGEDGALEWVLIHSKLRDASEPMSPAKTSVQYRLIDRVNTEIWEEHEETDGQTGKSRTSYHMVDEIAHNLGRVPVEILVDLPMPGESIVGHSSLQESTDVSIKMFNLQSCQQDNAYKTLYSQMVAPEDAVTAEERETTVGPSYIFYYNPEASAPQWIAPPTAPVQVLQELIDAQRQRIYELAQLDAGHAEKKKEELSGVAY